ncbi:MAG: toprim domain-containing protein [Nanoarchaeota archaeon]|nr:toprim domain-containing protein [Nanoarchaeota archaeon]
MKDVYDEIMGFLKRIKEEDKLVIVEGVNDKRALASFGVKRVKTLSRRALYKVVEEVRDKDVVLLVDLDRAGKKLYAYLNSEFSQRGVRVDNKFREFLFRKTKLRQIEGLKRYMERL